MENYIFGWKSGQDLKNWAAYPHQEFPGVSPRGAYKGLFQGAASTPFYLKSRVDILKLASPRICLLCPLFVDREPNSKFSVDLPLSIHSFFLISIVRTMRFVSNFTIKGHQSHNSDETLQTSAWEPPTDADHLITMLVPLHYRFINTCKLRIDCPTQSLSAPI